MKLEDAKSYINVGIKEGYFSEEMFEGLNDQELIGLAEKLANQSDNYMDVYRDEYDL